MDDLRIETCWSDFKCFNVKFYISAFVGVIIKVILSTKFKFKKSLTRKTCTLHEDPCTFMVASRSVLVRMRYGSEKIVQTIRTHILSSVTFFPENRAVYAAKWKNIVRPERP